jgi:hypothetical protein
MHRQLSFSAQEGAERLGGIAHFSDGTGALVLLAWASACILLSSYYLFFCQRRQAKQTSWLKALHQSGYQIRAFLPDEYHESITKYALLIKIFLKSLNMLLMLDC